MVNRNNYDEAINVMKDVYSHHEGFDQDSSLEQIIDLRDNFDIKLMIVGHFNAGKTSLINGLIGRPGFLKEEQIQQTAIATEIKYDETESAFAYDENGKKEPLNPLKQYTIQDYNHLEYRMNAHALKKISDFTIVDTPGFDSKIKEHTIALENYIGFGSAYLVVIDQEKGGIDDSTLDYIREISDYSDQIAVLINKCDKITPGTAESVKKEAESRLASYGLDYPVYTVSKKDPKIADKLVSIISEFDPQAAYNDVMLKRLRSALQNTEKVLSVIQKKIYLDTYDLDTEIAAFSRFEEQLTRTFNEKRKEAGAKLVKNVQNVKDAVESALQCKADSVAKAIVSRNQGAVEAIILETIRPVMVSEMKDLCYRQIDDVTESLDFSGLVSEEDRADLTDVVVNLAGSIKDLITDGTFETTEPEEKKKKSGNGDTIYHVVTGITAILTDVIAPWLEAVIVLLPEIFNLLKSLFGESDEEKARMGYINNIIPQVMNKLDPKICENIEKTSKAVLEDFEREVTSKIESIKQNIVDAKNKKDQKEQDFENKKVTLKNDIELVQKTLKELR